MRLGYEFSEDETSVRIARFNEAEAHAPRIRALPCPGPAWR